jgi:hypothetical protein
MQSKLHANALIFQQMKKENYFVRFLFGFLTILCVVKAEGQNIACETPDFFCKDTVMAYDYTGNGTCIMTLYYWFHVPATIDSVVVSSPAMTSFTCYGPFVHDTTPCTVLYPGLPIPFCTGSGTSDPIERGDTLPTGYYYLKVVVNSCVSAVGFHIYGGELLCTPIACENCIGSFAPEPGKKYIISLWVREGNAPVTKTSYDKPQVELIFTGSGTTTLGPFTASGQIIDGWQRIEQEFTVPAGATAMEIKLLCDSASCYFDDIRIQPFDGSMKTYVFDPVTLRLVAELDERNYATFYEYDEEGKLVRIKKETERGIMTIQESKTSIKKGQ